MPTNEYLCKPKRGTKGAKKLIKSKKEKKNTARWNTISEK